MKNTLRRFVLVLLILSFSTLANATQEQVESFVTRFYEYTLERLPDQSGLDYWTDRLMNQGYTGSELAESFILSQEFIDRGTTNSEYLIIMYWAFFDREPGIKGYAYWLDQLNNRKSREDVLNGFIRSSEFYNLAVNYGITPFPTTAPPSWSASDSLTGCVSQSGAMRVVQDGSKCNENEWIMGVKTTSDTSPPRVYDGDGNLLGSLLGEYYAGGASPQGYTILSTKGYIYPLSTVTGTVYRGQMYSPNYSTSSPSSGIRSAGVYFADSTCTGQAYVQASVEREDSNYIDGLYRLSYMPTKTAFYNSHTDELWYTGENLFDDSSIEIYLKRTYSCDREFSPGAIYVEGFLNDTNVTGIPNKRVSLPIMHR